MFFKVTVPLSVAGITQMYRRVQKRVTQGLCIISAVEFCLVAGFALFTAAGRAAYMMKAAVRGIEAVTALRGMNLCMFGDLPGNGGRRLVEPVSDITQGAFFAEQGFNADTVIRGQMGRFFLLHDKSSFQKRNKSNNSYCMGKQEGKQ